MKCVLPAYAKWLLFLQLKQLCPKSLHSKACKLQSATEVAKLKCKLCQRKSETSIFESSKNRNLKGNHNSQIESWIICLNSSAYSRAQEATGGYKHMQAHTGAYKSAPNGNDLFLSLD